MIEMLKISESQQLEQWSCHIFESGTGPENSKKQSQFLGKESQLPSNFKFLKENANGSLNNYIKDFNFRILKN